MENKKTEHDLNEEKLHLENEEIKDHYHAEHHIYDNGQHDDVLEDDFSIKHSFKYSRINLIYKISATGIFMALAIAATGIDVGIETLGLALPPINGVFVTLRIFDILVILIALSAIGPLFASIIGLTVPFIHYAMHSHGSAITPVVDSFSYVAITWLLWLLFYGIFRNSYFHKEVATKKDVYKKFMPLPFFVIFGAIILTGAYILNQYISSLETHDHSNETLISLRHEEHEEIDHQWDALTKAIAVNTIIVMALNMVRFLIIYLLFVVIESRLKVINHKFR